MYHLAELQENQLRELVNARSAWHNFQQARREAQQVKGSMVWKKVGGHSYLIRKSAAGAQKSLGPKGPETEAMDASFQARKEVWFGSIPLPKGRGGLVRLQGQFTV